MAVLVEHIKPGEYHGWLGVKRRFIYPFKWFYQSHIQGFWFRLRCVRLFASAVWHWDSCDYSPTLEMMNIAFREISRLHREHGQVVDSPRVARHTLIVAELCRRLGEGSYYDLAGYARFDQMTDRERAAWAKHVNYLAQQDAEYLGRMFRFVRHWWQ